MCQFGTPLVRAPDGVRTRIHRPQAAFRSSSPPCGADPLSVPHRAWRLSTTCLCSLLPFRPMTVGGDWRDVEKVARFSGVEPVAVDGWRSDGVGDHVALPHVGSRPRQGGPRPLSRQPGMASLEQALPRSSPANNPSVRIVPGL